MSALDARRERAAREETPGWVVPAIIGGAAIVVLGPLGQGTGAILEGAGDLLDDAGDVFAAIADFIDDHPYLFSGLVLAGMILIFILLL